MNDVILKYRYGEVVPLGPNYLPSYAAGVRAGIKELGPRLIDHDPTQLRVINAHMDYHLKGTIHKPRGQLLEIFGSLLSPFINHFTK